MQVSNAFPVKTAGPRAGAGTLFTGAAAWSAAPGAEGDALVEGAGCDDDADAEADADLEGLGEADGEPEAEGEAEGEPEALGLAPALVVSAVGRPVAVPAAAPSPAAGCAAALPLAEECPTSPVVTSVVAPAARSTQVALSATARLFLRRRDRARREVVALDLFWSDTNRPW
ncbi:hypothetical protein [Kitasatospora sp. SUK 42]|uniref:hypothetical protein n=1 Tax=Kitasatospora sp. SUK 42 TaxID=1588882 RepID=UPI0018C91905|nr:hypothetical protein [Kitasatospora sp. SUK 42]MBV2156687.1 hypothetical protein [Kitasatospora sp. SUK 42]